MNASFRVDPPAPVVINAASRFRPNVVSLPTLGSRVEAMIRTQMEAYPGHWSEAERREAAEAWLRGSGDVA